MALEFWDVRACLGGCADFLLMGTIAEGSMSSPFPYRKEIFPMEKQNTTTSRHEVLLAAAVIAALPKETSEADIEDISLLLFKLKKEGIDLGEVALRRVPRGYYSEDIETLVGHFLAAEYATQFSPVRLTPKGRQALTEIIAEERKENPNAIKQIEAVLGKIAT